MGWVIVAVVAAHVTACTAGSSGSNPASESGSSGHPAGGGGAGGASGSAGSGGSSGSFLDTVQQSSSSSNLDPDAACSSVSQTAVNQKQPADIVWVIDNSGSMLTEAAAVQDNMNTFAQTIAASGIDVHVAVISAYPTGIPFVPPYGVCIPAPLGSGTCPGDSLSPTFLHVDDEVHSNDLLEKLVADYDQYKSILRPSSVKTFVVVTDDKSDPIPVQAGLADPPASAIMPADQFTWYVNELDPSLITAWQFSGIYCFTNCPIVAADVGTDYATLVTQTGGVAGDMCAQNFGPVITSLAQGIVESAQLDCKWTIPPPPEGEEFNAAMVNVQFTPSAAGASPEDIYYVKTAADCGAAGGWYYDDVASPTEVLVCPSTCTTIQADNAGKIDILFGCGTIALPE